MKYKDVPIGCKFYAFVGERKGVPDRFFKTTKGPVVLESNGENITGTFVKLNPQTEIWLIIAR